MYKNIEHPQYLIVGSGLTGATLAHILHSASKSVVVVDRRSHIGGNVYDTLHKESGIRIHTYGPHYFRTNSERLWSFVNQFAHFYRYEPIVKAFINEKFETWPLTIPQIERICGSNWKSLIEFTGKPANFEQYCLSIMPSIIYKTFIHGYTQKQWGTDPKTLSVQLGKRIPIRPEDQQTFLTEKYQGIPSGGYHEFMKTMLKDIPVLLNYDYLNNRKALEPELLTIFTGPIDEYFGFDLGHLKYRGQQRIQKYLPDTSIFQCCGQVNYPLLEDGDFIRCLEWRHMMEPELQSNCKGTVITYEHPNSPINPNEFEYPFPDSINANLYMRYLERANADSKIIFCGRLGKYQYYNMDQAIAAAFTLAERLLNTNTLGST